MSSPKMTRVQAVLALTGIDSPAPFDDEWMFTACPACGAAQTLGECTIRPKGTDTRYRCKNGCLDLLVVSRAAATTDIGQSDEKPTPAGYRFGDYVVRNPADLVILVGAVRIRLPASADVAASIPTAGTRPVFPTRRARRRAR